MKIRFNKMEGHTFIVHSKNERVVLDRENHDIQIDTADSGSLVIERETTGNILNLRKWKQKVSWKQWIIVFFTFLGIFLYDMLCMSIKRLADFVDPLSEVYCLKLSEKTDRCELTYHKATFETVSQRYIYPYIVAHSGEKLECRFSLNDAGLEVSFFCAKLYYFFLVIPVVLVSGIGAGAIWHSDSAILGSILVSSVICFVSMNTYLNGRKRKLLRQLRNEW